MHNATGNVLDEKLIGNLAVNVLSGLAGNDTLDGGSRLSYIPIVIIGTLIIVMAFSI
jgi:hypothetical protein